MAAFVMQVLGYEVAALNTVQFSTSSSSADYSQDSRTYNDMWLKTTFRQSYWLWPIQRHQGVRTRYPRYLPGIEEFLPDRL